MKQVIHQGRGLFAFALLIAALLALWSIPAQAQRAADAVQLKQVAHDLKAHDLGKAEATLQAILKRHPGQPDALNFLGVIRAEQQRFAEAESLFQRAIQSAPRLTSAYLNLAFLYKQAGQPARALVTFENAAKLFPGNPEILDGLAMSYADRGDFQMAIKTLTAIPATARPADYWEVLARLQVSAGDFAKAEASLRQVLAQKPDSITTLRQLAGVRLKLGDTPRAWEAMAQALRLAPNSSDLLYEFAQLSLQNQLAVEAVIAMRKALLLEAERPEYLFLLGEALLNTADYHAALTPFERYAQLKPADARGHLYLGWSYYLEKDFDKARLHLEQCLKLNPEEADAYYHLGVMAYEAGELGRAQELFAQVVKRQAAHARAHLGLGMVYAAQGQYERARDALEASARSDGDEPKVHYQLSQVYARLGDLAHARREQQLYTEAQKRTEEKLRSSQRLPYSTAPRADTRQ
jgi:Flp pilus assembly protein TadD